MSLRPSLELKTTSKYKTNQQISRVQVLSELEIERVRKLAKEIRKLKESDYDAITWEGAIQQVLSVNIENEEDLFKTTVLLDYFLDEERMSKIVNLSIFLESLPEQIEELKHHANGYALDAFELVSLRQRIEQKIAGLEYPRNQNEAYHYYQLLIQRVFSVETLDQLLQALTDLSTVLNEFYPTVYPDVKVIAENSKEIRQLATPTDAPLTKKEMAAATGIPAAAIGLIMSRLAQLGIFEVRKNGRFNTYRFVRSDFETNLLRKKWDWLWSVPYKKLNLLK